MLLRNLKSSSYYRPSDQDKPIIFHFLSSTANYWFKLKKNNEKNQMSHARVLTITSDYLDLRKTFTLINMMVYTSSNHM